MLKTLLAILVSMAMSMGGMAALPAVPETEQILTISDVNLSVNGESVALEPAAQMSTALGTDEVDLHFQINMPDGTLMPVSGKLTNDGVQFILAENGKAYTISEETIYELLGVTEEDFSLSMPESSAKIMELARDPEFGLEVSEKMLAYLTSLADAEPETEEIEWNGETLQVKKWIINTDAKEIYGCYDVLMNSGNEELKSYLQGLLDMTNELLEAEGEEPVANFAGVVEHLGVELPIYMELSMNEDQSYANVLINMMVEENMLQITSETTATTEGVHSTMEMHTMEESCPVHLSMEMNIAGSVYAPESVEINFDLTNHEEFSIETVDENSEDGTQNYTDVSDTSVEGSFSWIDTDGLKDVNVALTAESHYSDNQSGEDEYKEYGSNKSEMKLQYSETSEDDGSITGLLHFDLLANDMPFSADLRLNRAQIAYEDDFAGREAVELTADVESKAYGFLRADAMRFTADVARLGNNESLQRLYQLFEGDTEVTVEEDKK